MNVDAAITVVVGSNLGLLRTAAGGGASQAIVASARHGTDGDDAISGGPGNDVLNGNAGSDVIAGGGGDDIANGGDGADILMGRAGEDTLSGGNDDDLLIGGRDDDMLMGGAGNDRLYGGAGDDMISGGTGDDDLWGGSGADQFIFNGGMDVIADYAQGIDGTTLDGAIWTGLTSVADVLFLYGSIDGTRATIDLGNGDTLHVDGVVDYATFGQDIALF